MQIKATRGALARDRKRKRKGERERKRERATHLSLERVLPSRTAAGDRAPPVQVYATCRSAQREKEDYEKKRAKGIGKREKNRERERMRERKQRREKRERRRAEREEREPLISKVARSPAATDARVS